MKKSPIFIHSLFRASSTYIFNVFRRSTKNYWCYQEPLHEIAVFSRDDPEQLLRNFDKQEMRLNRHPPMDKPYFQELYDIWPAWKDTLSPSAVYNGYFSPPNADIGILFWQTLINAAKGRPVFQECRTPGRIRAIKEQLGGYHIYLWRNPWDQWWSYKVMPYFDVVNQLIVNAPNSPPAVNMLRTALSIEPYSKDDLGGAFAYYGDRPLTSEESYLVFYLLWCLGLKAGSTHAHLMLNIDRLNESTDYQEAIQTQLAEVDINGIEFTDCQVPQGCYLEEDRVFFTALEEKVHFWLKESGWSQDNLNKLKILRQQFQPTSWNKQIEALNPRDMAEQASRIQILARRFETDFVEKHRDSTAKVNVKAQEAEVKAQEAEVKAQEAEVKAQEAEVKAQEAEAFLNMVYASRSWRITAPLRVIGHVGKENVKVFKGKIERLARSLLVFGLYRVRAIPPLQQMLSSLARRFPSAGTPFLRIAQAHSRPDPRVLHTAYLEPVDKWMCQTVSHAIQHRFAFSPSETKRVLYYYVDHTINCPVNTGMQRVARGLARGLIEKGENVVFVRWSPALNALVKINRYQLKHLCAWQGPILSEEMLQIYHDSGVSDKPIENHVGYDGSWLIVPEVTHINYHGYAPTIDMLMAAKSAKLKTAFIFYDAIPLRRNEFADIAQLHAEYMQHLLLADLIVPISNWSARDLVSFFINHEYSHLTAIPVVEPLLLPGDTWLLQDQLDLSIAAERIILSVGTIELRKNQSTLLRAFDKFCERHKNTDWKLVLVGNLHQNMTEELNAAVERNNRIIFRGNINDAELARLYRTCSFTVFPSEEEGFGLPIVESLGYGKPCICANFGAMSEAADGGGCLTVDVRNYKVLAKAIDELANSNEEVLNKLKREIARRYTVTWSSYTMSFSGLLDRTGDPISTLGVIYYCVHMTCKTSFNSGIQRVVRSLARSLIETGVRLIPVKWDAGLSSFVNVSKNDLEHLARWNGPSPDQWYNEHEIENISGCDWLFYPELIINPDLDVSTLEQWAKSRRMRTAWIFYDVIPWKLKELYTDGFLSLYAKYLRGLESAALIFPISKYSARELLRVIGEEGIRMPDQLDRVIAKILPGEFSESERVYKMSQRSNGVVRILSVGTVESRKNHLGLLRAFEIAQTKLNIRLELRLVGRPENSDHELIAEVQRYVDSNSAIHWEQKADDSHLDDLYHGCDFTVFPSIEEGFGLPILESLWHARPCICRNSSAMKEVAIGGGCLMTETTDVEALASAIMKLAVDEEYRLKLAQEAIIRPFKKWRDYAEEIIESLAKERVIPFIRTSVTPSSASWFRMNMVNLKARPLLSICITTYNRAGWLSLSLKNLVRLMPTPVPDVEIVVCDNTSTDETPEVVKPYKSRSDFCYYRNPSNVGMLGNLRVTAHHARGEYIWMLGDDDLIANGAIKKIITTIKQNPKTALIYLNYAYTREEDAKKITDLDKFIMDAIPITKPTSDVVAPVSRLSTLSENFFTAIYCLVFRRDHALRAYTQNTSGRPFSTMLTCIPTTYYVLHNMLHEQGVWLGTPQVIVNMNVSWLKYATIWILERIPEAFNLAEKMGALPDEVDRCRIAHLPSVWHWFGEIIKEDPEGNAAYFNPARLFSRFKHLREFQMRAPEIIKAYREAHRAYPERFPVTPEALLLNLSKQNGVNLNEGERNEQL